MTTARLTGGIADGRLIDVDDHVHTVAVPIIADDGLDYLKYRRSSARSLDGAVTWFDLS